MKITMTIAFLGLALFAFGQATANSEGGPNAFDGRSGGLYVPDADGARNNRSTGISYGTASEKKTLTGGTTTTTTGAKRPAEDGDSFSFAGVSQRVVIPVGVGAAVSCVLAIYFVFSRRARRKKRQPAVAVMNLHASPASVYQNKTAATDGRPRKAA
jgi:hypothetical protein